MESLLHKAQYCLDSKPSESSIQYFVNFLDIVNTLMLEYAQDETSNQQEIESHVNKMVKKTIPNDSITGSILS